VHVEPGGIELDAAGSRAAIFGTSATTASKHGGLRP
jgi:hypothetical protein